MSKTWILQHILTEFNLIYKSTQISQITKYRINKAIFIITLFLDEVTF